VCADADTDADTDTDAYTDADADEGDGELRAESGDSNQITSFLGECLSRTEHYRH
jgi:hypothetical protein